MKIGLDIRNIGKKRTGDEVVFFNLAVQLARLDNQNQYFLFTDTNDTQIIKSIAFDLGIENKSNFKIISLSALNRFTWNLFTLPRYLRDHAVDIYHTQYITPFFVSRKIKIITTIHDVSFRVFPRYIRFSDRFFLNMLIPLSLRRADKIIAVSKFTRDEIIRWYPRVSASKIEVAYNAISENFFHEDCSFETLESVRKKYKLPSEFILYLGTMQPRKNIPALIEAYAQLRKKIPEIKLVIGGKKDGHNFDFGIDKKIKKYFLEKDVIFPGYIDEKDKPALFRLSCVFCFPSLYEGFGVPIIEAMASGTPVIASNIPAHKEIAGESALFFNPESSKDLEEKLYQVCTDKTLQNSLKEKGEIQIQKFSWKKTAEKMLEIYHKTLR